MLEDSWRGVILELRKRIRNTYASGNNNVKLHDLENVLDDIEDDFLISHEKKLLEHINDPQANYFKEFNAGVDKYGKTMAQIGKDHKAYTQLVITAGYVTFLGLWAVTKDQYSGVSHSIAGLCLILSASIFVLFEVIKMTIEGLNFDYQLKVILNARFKINRGEKFENLSLVHSKDDWFQIIMHKWWLRCLLPSVIFGIAGILILLFIFTKTIWLDIFEKICSL